MLKQKFELESKFQPYFSYPNPVFLASSNNLFCGRNVEDTVEITVADGEKFTRVEKITDEDKVTSFVVSPDGSMVALATKSLFLKLMEFPSLKVIKSWRSCHQKGVCIMAVNSDVTRLATGSSDTVVRLWHLGYKEGYSCSCRCHNSMTTLLKFHPTQQYLFSSALGDYCVAVWNSETGKKVASLDGHQSIVTGLAFSPDGETLVTCGRDKVIMTWSCPQFSRQNVLPTFESLEACVFLPLGSLANHLGKEFVETQPPLLLSGGQWGCLRVWNILNGRCLLEVKGPLDRSPQTGAADHRRDLIDYGLHSIVGLQIVSIGSNSAEEGRTDAEESTQKLLLIRQSNHIEFYDPVCAKLTSEFLGDIGEVDQLCVVGKSHNRLIAVDGSPQLKLFLNPYGMDSHDGSWSCHLVPGGHTDVVTDVCVSQCGEWTLSGAKDRSLCLWRVIDRDSTEGGKRLKGPSTLVLLVERLEEAHAAHITSVCFDKSNNFVVSSSEDNVLKAWSLDLSQSKVLSDGSITMEDSPRSVLSEWMVVHGAHKSTINSIDVSVNNQLIATASRDKTVKIWKVAKHNLECTGVLQGHRRGVWSVCFSKREKVVLTASGDGDVRIWNLKDFSCMRTLEGHEQPVYKAVFLSDDRQVLSCDQRGLVRLWDINKPSSKSKKTAKSNKEDEDVNDTAGGSKVFEAHDGRIWSLAVCPDESGFYTGGEDETLCYFKDVTEQVEEENTKKLVDFVQNKQMLDNLVREKRYAEALRLAVKLDHPKRGLDILQDLILFEPQTDGPSEERSGSYHSTQATRVSAALNELLHGDTSEDEQTKEMLVQRLLGYAINWNTRARTSVVAQYVLNWILSTFTPEHLLRWPGFAKTVESLLPYTARHYQRISRLQEQLAILDYLCEYADERQAMKSPSEMEAVDSKPMEVCSSTVGVSEEQR
ncbi:unnamed protein product [Calicophoron daubneyi]|uniref:U3 small nucleolar RNA-associated protein 13 C-terminal domain-containing protein n=1 Tax=Calicophoron daubneyi TaxID=300641 RepID=A0AAV2TJL0_CALDB